MSPYFPSLYNVNSKSCRLEELFPSCPAGVSLGGPQELRVMRTPQSAPAQPRPAPATLRPPPSVPALVTRRSGEEYRVLHTPQVTPWVPLQPPEPAHHYAVLPAPWRPWSSTYQHQATTSLYPIALPPPSQEEVEDLSIRFSQSLIWRRM